MAEVGPGQVAEDIEPTAPMREDVPRGVKRGVVEVGEHPSEVAIIRDEENAISLEDAPPSFWIFPPVPHLALGDLESVFAVERQNQHTSGRHDPLKLLKPQVLVSLVNMSEYAVVYYQVELAITIRQWRFGRSVLKRRKLKMLPIPIDRQFINITTMELPMKGLEPSRNASRSASEVKDARKAP